MKMGRRGQNILRFEGEIGERTWIGGIIVKLEVRVNWDIENYLFPLETGFTDAPV